MSATSSRRQFLAHSNSFHIKDKQKRFGYGHGMRMSHRNTRLETTPSVMDMTEDEGDPLDDEDEDGRDCLSDSPTPTPRPLNRVKTSTASFHAKKKPSLEGAAVALGGSLRNNGNSSTTISLKPGQKQAVLKGSNMIGREFSGSVRLGVPLPSDSENLSRRIYAPRIRGEKRARRKKKKKGKNLREGLLPNRPRLMSGGAMSSVASVLSDEDPDGYDYSNQAEASFFNQVRRNQLNHDNPCCCLCARSAFCYHYCYVNPKRYSRKIYKNKVFSFSVLLFAVTMGSIIFAYVERTHKLVGLSNHSWLSYQWMYFEMAILAWMASFILFFVNRKYYAMKGLYQKSLRNEGRLRRTAKKKADFVICLSEANSAQKKLNHVLEKRLDRIQAHMEHFEKNIESFYQNGLKESVLERLNDLQRMQREMTPADDEKASESAHGASSRLILDDDLMRDARGAFNSCQKMHLRCVKLKKRCQIEFLEKMKADIDAIKNEDGSLTRSQYHRMCAKIPREFQGDFRRMAERKSMKSEYDYAQMSLTGFVTHFEVIRLVDKLIDRLTKDIRRCNEQISRF